MEHVIEISEENERILRTDMANIEEWLNFLIEDKIRTCMRDIITSKTDRNYKKISEEDARKLINKIPDKDLYEGILRIK